MVKRMRKANLSSMNRSGKRSDHETSTDTPHRHYTCLQSQAAQRSARGSSMIKAWRSAAPSSQRGVIASPEGRWWIGLGAMFATLLFVVALLLVPRSDGQAFLFDDGADLLDPDDAFALSHELEDEVLVLRWQIADAYYMYREQFEFEPGTPGLEFGIAQIPNGTIKEDEFFGRVETYRQKVEIRLPIVSAEAGEHKLIARSQGCADVGVCYPPHFQPVTFSLARSIGSSATAADSPAVQDSDSGRGGDLSDATAPSLSESSDPGASTALEGLSEFSRTISDAVGISPNDLLDPEVAFAMRVESISQNGIVVTIDVADDYYLYQESIDFRPRSIDGETIELGPITLPNGLLVEDEFFGESIVYRGAVDVFIPVMREADNTQRFELDVDYQGCADAGICYPPLTQTLAVEFVGGSADATVASASPEARAPPESTTSRDLPVSEQDRIAAQLSDGRLWFVILAFFGFGLLLTFTPCVFPMIPILSNIIVGQKNLTTSKAFSISLIFVLAMAATYTAAGVFAGLAGANLQAAFQNPWIIGTFVVIFILLALSMFGFYELQVPSSIQSRLSQVSNRQSGGTYIGAAIMGFLSALIVGPCVTAPLIGALLYISQTGDALLGGVALFALSMGMGTPLLIIGTSAGKLLPKAGPWMNTIKAVFGVGLLAMGIWLLERVVPGEIALLLWGTLLVVVAIYMGALSGLAEGSSGWHKLWKGLGIVLLVYGVVLLIGAASGAKDPMRPFEALQTTVVAGSGGENQIAAAPAPEWNEVSSLDELDAALAAAQTAGRPAMVDFTADWCIDCQRMERTTFRDPAVRSALAQMQLIKIDVTANDANHRELLRNFNLFGPPAYLFYDDAGIETRAMRAIGFLPPERLLALLDRGLGIRP